MMKIINIVSIFFHVNLFIYVLFFPGWKHLTSIAIANSSALLNEETNSGTSIGIKLFALFIKFPSSNDAPLLTCATIILSASSTRTGMNLNAIVIIIIISVDGNFNFSKGRDKNSRPFVNSRGDVVNVKSEEIIIKIISLEPIKIPLFKPSFVNFRKNILKIVSPGVKKKWKKSVIIKSINIGFNPFKIDLIGILEIIMKDKTSKNIGMNEKSDL